MEKLKGISKNVAKWKNITVEEEINYQWIAIHNGTELVDEYESLKGIYKIRDIIYFQKRRNTSVKAM